MSTSDPETVKTLDTTLTTATVTTIVTTATTNVTRESAKKSARDEKEPIQIIRGRRVITLPPIEAPATRSKRLQARIEPAQKLLESTKPTEKFR